MVENSSKGSDFHEVKAVFWTELPDPRDLCAPVGVRTKVMLDRHSWKHIVDKHVLPGREPWGDVLSTDTLRKLCKVGSPVSFADPVVADAVARLGKQVRETLERPLALLFEARRLGGSGPTPPSRWMLVLPSGATAHVHETKKDNRLVTCYFPSYALVIRDRGFRWRHVVSHVVWRYGVVDMHRRALLLPTESTVKPAPQKGLVKALHSAIRFVTPASWGFCQELDGCPYRGRLDEWPAAEALSPRPRHRLKPRRRRSPDEEEPPA
jgi:hypothetical protein